MVASGALPGNDRAFRLPGLALVFLARGIPSILVWNYVSGQRVRCDRLGVPNLSLFPHFTEERSDVPAVHRVDGTGRRIGATVSSRHPQSG